MCPLSPLQRNTAAGRIVVPEFGTPVRQKLWSRLRHLRQSVMSDNTMITVQCSDIYQYLHNKQYLFNIFTQVYPFNGELYTFYESPYLHRLDRDLSTLGR